VRHVALVPVSVSVPRCVSLDPSDASVASRCHRLNNQQTPRPWQQRRLSTENKTATSALVPPWPARQLFQTNWSSGFSTVVVVAVTVSTSLRMRRFNSVPLGSCTFLDRQLLPGKSSRLPPGPAAPAPPLPGCCHLFPFHKVDRTQEAAESSRRPLGRLQTARHTEMGVHLGSVGPVKTPVGDTCGPVTGID
jgi:hypothetical protein